MKMASDDDDDYMSDKFLLNADKSSSLLYKQSEKRKHQLLKRKNDIDLKMKNKSPRIMEQEKREEGLSSTLPMNNKGCEMLMKMGYKPGKGIGKNESGIAEPVSIDLKINRSGLGKVKPKTSTPKINDVKLENMKTNDFRNRVAKKKLEKLTEIDLIKSQNVCEQLDRTSDLKEPKETWYWPNLKQTNEEENENEDDCENDEEESEVKEELPINEKLTILTNYLRSKYFYCVWCGITYNDENDISNNCPGMSREDH